MKDNTKPKRNEKGDIEFETVDLDSLRDSRFTYVFKYFDEDKLYYLPYFELFSKSKERMAKAGEDSEYFEVKLYKSPDEPPYDFYIRHNNNQLAMLIEFFKEVFHEKSFEQGYLPQHKYFKVIIPRQKYLEIINFINSYELLPIRDLLFEVIATAQHIYVEDIAFWERPEMQKLITSAEKETGKTMEILEKLDTSAYERGDIGSKPPSELIRINFVFNDGTVKLEHRWLTKEFVQHFKQYYDNLHFKDWRQDLARYPLTFREDRENQKFKYKLAISLYNLLTQTGLFKVTKSQPTPNRLMLCIAGLLEFCLIKVAEPDELDVIKAKNIRNWIRRNEIEPALTHAKIPFDKDRLLKYFEPYFIGLGEEVKRVDALSIGFSIAQRFNLESLEGDLSHIAQCLKQVNFFIGHQVTGSGNRQGKTVHEFENFKKLLNGVKSKQNIVSIKYKLEGDGTEYELTQRLPLYQIEEAIKYYMDDQRVEIDTDLVSTSVIKTGDDTFSIIKGDQFALPEERFMVRFVKSFYDYLLAESPPGEFESIPSYRYYNIIGLMLLRAGFFYNQLVDERFVNEKVKQWHQLTK